MNLLIQKAIIFAAVKHRDQKRKGTEIPYIVHPMEVMQILTFLECDENVIVAGILHDTVEDTDTTENEIEYEFGTEILKIVKAESEDKSKLWKERKNATFAYLKSATNEEKIVCFADKLSNARSIYRDLKEVGDELWKRFNADIDSLKWYYSSFIPIFSKIETYNLCDNNKGRLLFTEYCELIDKIFPKT